MKTIKALLIAASMLVPASVLAGSGTITVKDAGGATQTFVIVTDGSGHYLQSGVVCDYSAGANCASVDSSHGFLIAGEGTAGSAAGGVVTVQGVASMTPFLVNPGTVATWGIGTAGSPSTNVMTVQGVSSGTPQPISAASGTIASGAVASGAVASGAFASGALASGSVSDGAVVTLGAKADAKSTATDTTAISIMQVLKEISFMAQTPAALPADQSVNTAQVNGVTTLTGAGAVGTGAQRVAVGGDTATIAGSAPGTAGTPSANVVSVQGVASGTVLPVGLNTTPTIANGNGVVPTQGGAVLSATNGIYDNILQGNAVLSTSNPIFASITDGTNKAAVKAAGSPATASDAGLTTAQRTYASSGTDQFALAVSTNTQLTVPATTTCAQITVEVASIRRTSDGTSASTTNGTLIPAGASWQDCGPLAAYKFTAVSGSPTIDAEYMK